MWRYYLKKSKPFIMVLFLIGLIIGLVYIGMKKDTQSIRDLDSYVFPGTSMGTAIKKTLYIKDSKMAERINEKIDDCIDVLDRQLSVRMEDSEISKFNRNYAVDGAFSLSDNIIEYLNYEMKVYEETNGAFSPCIRPLAELWGIEDGKESIPDSDSLKDVLRCIDANKLEIKENTVIFHGNNMKIDFGAIGKGIACDKVKEVLESDSIAGAVISIGGSILAYGSKGDGKPWHIGIRDPRGSEESVIGVIDCDSGSIISTSGDYEKFFELEEKRYHHIFDARTGYPVDNSLMSVTIISESGMESDALSTASFVMGLEDGMQYAKQKNVNAVFVTKDKKIYITEGLKKKFLLKDMTYQIAELP